MSDEEWHRRFGRLRLGAIVFDDGTVTPIDWRDLMWAARTVRGEVGLYDSAGPESDAVLWTMTNRLRVLKDQIIGRAPFEHAPPHRLQHMLDAYCAPVSRYQRTRGDAATQAKRRHFASMGPDDPDINPASIARVALLLRGGVSRAPYMRFVDFADCDCEGCGRDTHGPEDMRMGDCFWIGELGRTLNERSVYIAPPASRGTGLAVAVASVVVAAGAVASLDRWPGLRT